MQKLTNVPHIIPYLSIGSFIKHILGFLYSRDLVKILENMYTFQMG